MKFKFQPLNNSTGRIGNLSGFKRLPNVNFETPLLLIFTKTGSVPHLTKEVLKYVTSDRHMLLASLSSTISMSKSIEALNSTLGKFTSMEEHLQLLSIHDTAITTTRGHQKLNSVAVWNKLGRHQLTANEFMDVVEILQPDIWVALCDGDTDINSGKKRLFKAVNRSNALLEECLERYKKSVGLKSTAILGAVQGGYDLSSREYSINYLKDKPLSGYVIDGLHTNGPDTQSISIEQIRNIVQHTINLLPNDKPRVSTGCWNPITILNLIELGVDIFDSTYAYTMTEESKALTFLCDNDDCKHTVPFITLLDERHKDDFTPICEKCKCLACRSYTKAYIHHLCQTKEMLNLVLLMIHNMHQYLQFFQDIRNNMRGGAFKEFYKKIQSKFS
ncbi:queuine tRNA-ribosyltransferase accessory subunit 2-like [Prorops nasuta]|uniref:queuine tRNA-ribosyltransferase accessory subunit 2-like n=1 Tax=Prorops nasuta TaxID=863751 RepID=UPI0034CF21FD